MKKRLLNLATILMLTMVVVACSDDNNETEENETQSDSSVEVEEVTEGDLVVDKAFYGRTEPSQTTPIMLPMPGEIDSLEVSEGDEVKKDDTIAKLKTPAGTQTISAPKDGIVVNIDASEGDMASDEDPYALIANTKTMKLSFDVTSSDQSLFKNEDEYTVIFEDEKYDSEINQVGAMPGKTGLFTIEAKVKNEDLDILPGSVVKLNVPEKRAKESLIVPTEAVVEEDSDSYVFVVNGDQVKKEKIEVKESQTDKTAIDADIKEGDEVVTKGQLTLDDGSKVDVVEAGE